MLHSISVMQCFDSHAAFLPYDKAILHKQVQSASYVSYVVFDWELELERVRQSQLYYSDAHCLQINLNQNIPIKDCCNQGRQTGVESWGCRNPP